MELISISDLEAVLGYTSRTIAGGRRRWSRTVSDDDVSYFKRRAAEERQRAADAKDLCARQAHQRIAKEYERIARADNPIELRVISQ